LVVFWGVVFGGKIRRNAPYRAGEEARFRKKISPGDQEGYSSSNGEKKNVA